LDEELGDGRGKMRAATARVVAMAEKSDLLRETIDLLAVTSDLSSVGSDPCAVAGVPGAGALVSSWEQEGNGLIVMFGDRHRRADAGNGGTRSRSGRN
jgi:hypothetical protein